MKWSEFKRQVEEKLKEETREDINIIRIEVGSDNDIDIKIWGNGIFIKG